MKSLWDDHEAAQYAGDLGQRVYSSRLLGRDPSLVLHGGGNTSVKIQQKNLFGENEQVLYVKGSGWDLATIAERGFAPVRMQPLLRLATLEALSDTQMVNELRSTMTDASAPLPSVEAILHAILPFKFIDHTHADALIAVMNTPAGSERVAEIYGERVVIIPYAMPGFKLARLCAELWPKQATANTVGLVLMNHGLFTFGDSARVSYERMIELVDRAEEYLARHNAWEIASESADAPQRPLRPTIAALRRDVSLAAGEPIILATHADPKCLAFARRASVSEDSQQGPATPDHVLRTKRIPLVGRDVQAFRAAYEQYFRSYAKRASRDLMMLDPAPRVILDPELGLCSAGRNAADAAIVYDIYRHTIDIIARAGALGGWRALPAEDIFDVEYWELEQAKLVRAGASPPFAGEIALVTGAASGIGLACVESLAKRGAAVVALDRNEKIAAQFTRLNIFGFHCDVTEESAVADAIEAGVRRFGGLDMLVLNAGVFPPGRRIEAISIGEWNQVMRVNLDANVTLMREAYPLLKLSPRGGRVVIIGSKNVPAPGPGAAAYSASKAALTQLARVAALEWGADGIRVNVVHPNAVFDTGIWTDEVLEARARSYGLSVEKYKKNNVLKQEITSRDVAELTAELCGPIFAKTTGAQVPVDGGNERVI